MDNLSQIEIAKYLYDYSKLVQLMVLNPDKKIKDLFIENLEYEGRTEDANDEYYINTIRIAYIFTMLKAYSIGEDYTIKKNNNFINNVLVNLTFLKSKITGNLSSVSDKKLLQLIRNGFNHTHEENELYKISKDCQNITFFFQKPTSLQIQVDLPNFCNLINSIEDAAQTFNYFHFNKPHVSTIKDYINKFEITRTCFFKKIDPIVMNNFLKLENEGKHDDAKNYLLSSSENITKEISLSQIQRNLIANHISNALKNNVITQKELTENIEGTMPLFLRKVLPIPALKTDNYQLDSIMLNLAALTNLRYNELCSLVGEIVSHPDNTSSQGKKEDQEFYNNFKTYFSDKNEKITYATLLYIEYVLSVFTNNEDEIIIGGNSINSQNLRNSLVHSRWFINEDKILFFDAIPRIDVETDYNWQCELKLIDLINYCSDILTKKTEKEKNKAFIKTKK